MVTIPRIIVGISGASGMRIARTLLDVLLSETTVAIDLIVSEAARQVWTHELGSVPLPTDTRIMHFDNNDLAAAPASGSRRTLGMVIAPCSMATPFHHPSGQSPSPLASRRNRHAPAPSILHPQRLSA